MAEPSTAPRSWLGWPARDAVVDASVAPASERAWLHRLGLTHKYVILGAIVLAIIALPSTLYFRRALAEITIAQREAHAAPPLVALDDVIRVTQTHRGLSAGALSGNATLAARRPAARDAVVKAMTAVDAAFDDAAIPPALRARWREAADRWQAIERGVATATLTATDSTRLHTQLITAELTLTDELLAESGLSQDPDRATHFLVDAALVDLPWLTENLGLMRALGSAALTQGALTPEGRATLQGLRRRALELERALFRDLERAAAASPTLRAALDARTAASRAAVDAALAIADLALIGAPKLTLPAPTYFDALTATIDGLFTLNGHAMARMTTSLDDRAAAVRADAALVFAAMLLGLVGCAALAFAILRSISGPVGDAVAVASAVAAGDLGVAVPIRGSNELGRLMRSLAAMRDQLGQVVTQVRTGSDGVATASARIAQEYEELYGRNISQATALQETAASMEELGALLRLNAGSAREADEAARAASAAASHGGDVVAQVVDTMKGIRDGSKRIAEIIRVIDEIAFQTNLLALNAAVEAARAGDQGHGFAVVATEVRSLAARSAAEAKQIKSLITDTTTRVTRGAALVDQAGATMADIVHASLRVASLMGEIRTATSEQSDGMSHVATAINHIDRATQQNAALVEQMSAQASGLNRAAQDLVHTVAVFKLAAG